MHAGLAVITTAIMFAIIALITTAIANTEKNTTKAELTRRTIHAVKKLKFANIAGITILKSAKNAASIGKMALWKMACVLNV